MADGSGLSRYNYVSASTLTAVLQRMYRDPKHRESFLSSLPVAGRHGTMAARLRRTRAEGNAAVKTGSISNVRALSGFVRARNGETIVFSIIANDFIIPAATVNWITDLAVEILANFARERP
jgi:D-alanyl-D-alanine carboxypeptidase/D-alanyl-D-alanine-endopeptidase (penicillin-binding protein 4)